MPDFGRFTHVWLSPLGGMLPLRCEWCRRPATYLLTRQDRNNQTYSDKVCVEHANQWAPYAEGVQTEMEFDGQETFE
jgi:hypothetical protein